jgi:hypothetical protein
MRSPAPTRSPGLSGVGRRNVQVDERAAVGSAPDRDVVAAPAVVALLDHLPGTDGDQRRARRREHVLPLVDVPAARSAEARAGLSKVRVSAHGKRGLRRWSMDVAGSRHGRGEDRGNAGELHEAEEGS